jgi:hypothetical protein
MPTHSDLADHVLHSAAGQFTVSTDSQAADVARLLKLAVAAKKPKGLLLHFHGGLINKANGLAIANRLTSFYDAAGAYPVFFVWESGVWESLINNKDDLLRDPAFRELVKKVSEWVLKRTGGSAVFRGSAGQSVDTDKLRREYDEWFDGNRATPPVPDQAVTDSQVKTRGADHLSVDDLATSIEDGFDNDPDFRKAMQEAYNAQLPPAEIATRGQGTKRKADVLLLSEDAQSELFPRSRGGAATRGGVLSWIAIARFVAKIVLAVLKRHRGKRDHGFYCTVVEEVLRCAYGNLIGGVIWNQMKKDTADSFQAGPSFCGSGVIRELRALEREGQAFPQITLVGHSTGAIYICNFLDAAKAEGLTTPIKVVFLAPAVTHKMFGKAVAAHQGTSRLHGFRLFAMSDAREAEDQMLSILYTRSLLYFVSGLLEDEIDMPIAGMQRYLEQAVFSGDDFPYLKSIAAFLKQDPTRTVWSPSLDQGPGLTSDSKRHGDFDDDPVTLESVKAFI